MPSSANVILALLRQAAKEGNLLFRKDRFPKVLFAEGNIPALAPVSAVEPAGLYFAKSPRDLSLLIDPTGGGVSNQHKMITGFFLDKKDMVAYKEDDLSKYLDDIKEAFEYKGLPYFNKHIVNPLNELHLINSNVHRAGRNPVPYSNAIRDLFLRRKVGAVEFPDWIANQPELTQVAVLKPRSVLAKAGKYEGLLATLPLLPGSND